MLDRPTAALVYRYRIRREVGSGGMATVYLADDLKHGREVALKVRRPELAVTMGPERFARGIQVTARLQHPHIYRVSIVRSNIEIRRGLPANESP